MAATEVEIEVCERDGTLVDVIDGARAEESMIQKDGLGGARITYPTLHSKHSVMQLCKREVRVREDGIVKWWGVPVVGRSDMKRTTIQCLTCDWYYFKRLFGPNEPTATLLNGDFENGLANWTAVNLDSAAEELAYRARGTKAARLINSTIGEDAYLHQVVTYDPGGSPGSVVGWSVFAKYFIDDAGGVPYDGASYKGRGLHVEVSPTAGGAASDVKTATIPWANTKTMEWTPILIPEVLAPQGVGSSNIDIRLHCGKASIIWDVVAILPELFVGDVSLQYNDYSVLITDILNYAHAKGASLHIGTDIDPTGFQTNRLIPYSSHGVVGSALNDIVSAGICSMGVTWDAAGTTKTFRNWASRGVQRDDLPLELGRSIIDIPSYEKNGQAVINKGRGLGEGTGPTRTFAETTDTTDMGGLVLEGQVPVPSDTPLLELDRIVAEEVARLKRPPIAMEVVVPASYADQVELGDRAPTYVDHGAIQVAEPMEIVQITRLHHKGTARLVLNQPT